MIRTMSLQVHLRNMAARLRILTGRVTLAVIRLVDYQLSRRFGTIIFRV